MAFKIVVAPSAFADIDEAASYIAGQGTPERAKRWKDGALGAVRSLQDMPGRCAVIPESEGLGIVFRHLHYHSHRIVFEIDEPAQTVFIFRVVHSARRPLSLSDLV